MPARQPTPIGQKFNRLTVLSDAPRRSNRMVLAQCECGTVKEYVLSEVRLGKTRSCGCLPRDEPWRTHGHTRGHKFSPTYHSWAAMVTRCTNPNCRAWSYYGGRGIAVCERWLTFENFLADMGERPPGTTLDRRDGTRGYEPGNTRWATPKRQANNLKTNVIIEFRGRKLTVAEWSDETGLPYNTIRARIGRLGWSVERALTEKPAKSYQR